MLAAAMLATGPTAAASLQVAPTSITLMAKQLADGLWLSNSGTAPVQVQMRVYHWTQADGKDHLDATQELVVSPPMRGLAAGERQLIRIIRTTPSPTAEETTYRIIVDELPNANIKGGGMQFVLRYSVPVFVIPSQAITPMLEARVVAGANGNAMFEVSNRGNGHAQIADLHHVVKGKQTAALDGLVGYVLPGKTMRWSLGQPLTHFATGTFTARINGEINEHTLLTLPTKP